jgi:pimeloyl-ACP methyl ester carboxylesterase
MAVVEQQRVRLWQDKIETQVEVQGSGPPLVFLHGHWGSRADGDFVARLAQGHTVYAPRHPGTSQGDPNAIYELDNWWDLLAYYGELLDRLGLQAPALVGYSFGGMLACELAAIMPDRVGKLVLIDPLGLWRDDLPVRNPVIASPAELRRLLFAEPEGEAAGRFFSLPDDAAERADAQVAYTWSQACVGKFVWPLPDKGLHKRIHRVAAPTLIDWGKQDGVIPAAYADDFAARIPGARVALIDHAAHLPHLEQPAPVAQLVREFLQE